MPMAYQTLAPVGDLVRHENILFPDVKEMTKYHGPPNDSVDEAWNDLYKGSRFVS